MGTERYLTNIHDEMLESVYMMRRLSFISSISSSIYIAIFTLFSSIHTMLFIPILWSVSCICLALNFVRNRIFIHSKYLSFKLWSYSLSSQCTCNRTCPQLYKTYKRRISSPSSRAQSPHSNSPSNKQTQSPSHNNNSHNLTSHTHDSAMMNPVEIIEMKEEDKEEPVHDLPSTHTQSIAASVVMLNTNNKTEEVTPSTTATATKHVRWYNAIKNKISTPLTNDAIDFSFSPIAPTIHIPTTYSPKAAGGAHPPNVLRKQSASKSKGKALKVLGIDRDASTIDKKDKSDRSQSSKSPHKIYMPPTTPVASLFVHLKTSAQSHRFPNTLPLPPDPNVCDETPNSQDTRTFEEDDTVIQQRDEFNEHEMAEIAKRFEKRNDLIRVSAQQPHLLMQRISVNLESPPVSSIEHAALHISPRESLSSRSVASGKSPFARKKDDEKQVSLLMDDHNYNYRNEEKDEEEDNEVIQGCKMSIEISHESHNVTPIVSPQLQVANSASKSHRRSQSAQVVEVQTLKGDGNEARLSAKGLAMLKKISPRRLKNINLSKRIRSVSEARGLGNDEMMDGADVYDATDADGMNPSGIMYDNPDVVSMFGVLAKHGFYDNNNVVCAKQLRDYNMKL